MFVRIRLKLLKLVIPPMLHLRGCETGPTTSDDDYNTDQVKVICAHPPRIGMLRRFVRQ
jgi:hypothetical protein